MGLGFEFKDGMQSLQVKQVEFNGIDHQPGIPLQNRQTKKSPRIKHYRSESAKLFEWIVKRWSGLYIILGGSFQLGYVVDNHR